MAKNFKDLSEREILALAISLEEEDGRVLGDLAEGLRDKYPATAKMFDEMQVEESEHRRTLIDTYRQRFGEHIPLIRRQDVKGFVEHRCKQVDMFEIILRYHAAVVICGELLRDLLRIVAFIERRDIETD